MEKQTAVEWLEQYLKDSMPGVYFKEFKKEIKQAKAMEKQQIIEAYDKGYLNLKLGDDDAAQQYYNIKFKK